MYLLRGYKFCADDTLLVINLHSHDKEWNSKPERDILMDKIVGLQLQARTISESAFRNQSPLLRIHMALLGRTTSRAEDVPLCASSIIGKDITSIASGPSDLQSRYKAFYILVGRIPNLVLWVDGVKRLSISPVRWAPALIGPGSHFGEMLLGGTLTSTCDERGLHLSNHHPGFMVQHLEVGSSSTQDTLPSSLRVISTETNEPCGTLLTKDIRDLNEEPRLMPLPGPSVKLAILVWEGNRPSSIDDKVIIVLIEPRPGEVDVYAEDIDEAPSGSTDVTQLVTA